MYKVLVTIALLSSFALGACGTLEVSMDRGFTPTAAVASVTAAAAASTATPAMTELAVETSTPSPTQQPQSAGRIRFASGATQSVTQGALQAGETRTFVLTASKGQILIASVESPAQDVHLTISGADGGSLLPRGPDIFSGSLPATQDYYFQLTAGAAADSFTLNITVAARIEFAAGAKKSVLTGRTVDGLSVVYSAYALQGQKMHVTLDVPDDSAGLTIWGLTDGQPYARAQNGVRDFSMVLPAGQDYMIQVMPRAGQVVDYTLTVEID
ncbi:MAG: hypothetical protein ACM3QS_05535 [Bacteroidota bacterium]